MAKAKKSKKPGSTILPAVATAGAVGVGSYFFARWALGLQTRDQIAAFGVAGLGLLTADYLFDAPRSVDFGGSLGAAAGVGLAYYQRASTPTTTTRPSTDGALDIPVTDQRRVLPLEPTPTSGPSRQLREAQIMLEPNENLVVVAREENLTPAQLDDYRIAFRLIAAWQQRMIPQYTRLNGDMQHDILQTQSEYPQFVRSGDRPGKLDRRMQMSVRQALVEIAATPANQPAPAPTQGSNSTSTMA